MGAAFEVNRQMCDLEIDRERWDKIGKEWASKKQEIVDSIFNGIDMEKKKMMKAEAFEYLKGKKVRVCDREMNDKVQSKLFACGVQWKNGGTNVCYYSDYLVITPHGLLCHCDGLGVDYWNRLFHEEISADDILSIEIVDKKNELDLNYDKVIELAKPLMHYLSETGHTEVISVCKEGISAIPMGTFLYKG